MMLPFALLVLVFLFLVFKLVNRSDGADTVVAGCGDRERQLGVEKGDTCWAIAEANGLSVEALLRLRGNQGVDCGNLRIGQSICVLTLK